MSASLLGKRRHDAADVEVRSTRSKRRIVLSGKNDENENPFQSIRSEIEDDSERSEVALPAKRIRKATARAAASKHAQSAASSKISPSKIRGHFKVGKASITVFEDGKSNGTSTPSTPRHRDAFSNKIAVTPRHRQIVAKENTPHTPKTPSNGSLAIYNQARQLFSRCSNPGRLIGRDHERDEILNFINTRVESIHGGCMYVSGPPGTGKSALVQEVLQQVQEMGVLKTSVINCMSVRNTKDLSSKLAEDLDLDHHAGFTYLQSLFTDRKVGNAEHFLVILDEVDRLVDLDLELLYSLFEWSMQKTSRLILLGIANALDLTDRFLPRLKTRNLKPELLPFLPYSAAQVAEVLKAKLQSLQTAPAEDIPFFQVPAIQFCAKKVACQTGDLRKAFDICRRAVDLVERETRDTDAQLRSPSKTPLIENINLSSPPTPRSPEKKAMPVYDLRTAPKVSIAHVARVTAQVFGNGTVQRLGSLNLQQKAVLCALSALEKRKREQQLNKTMFATPSKHNSTAATIQQLFEAYSQLCTRDHLLHPLAALEFRDVLSGLETLGVVTAADSKNGGFATPITPSRTPSRAGRKGFGAAAGEEKRFASAVGHKELAAALEGNGAALLRDILDGQVLL